MNNYYIGVLAILASWGFGMLPLVLCMALHWYFEIGKKLDILLTILTVIAMVVAIVVGSDWAASVIKGN